MSRVVDGSVNQEPHPDKVYDDLLVSHRARMQKTIEARSVDWSQQCDLHCATHVPDVVFRKL